MTKLNFSPAGGYRRLNAWIMASIVQVANFHFCRRFLVRQFDPTGRQFDQMTQAARSGQVNLAEGSARSATSKETEMKLTDVSRASLGELLGDLEIFLAERDAIPWSIRSQEHQAVSALNFAPFEYTDDVLHDYWTWFHREKRSFAPWVEHHDPIMAANALIILIRRAMAMLAGQMRGQGEAFLEEGGFRERLTQARLESRDAPTADAPTCPDCGKPMRQRTARKGPHAGEPFWSCSGYPECRGTRPVEAPRTQDPGPKTQAPAS